MSKFEDNPFSDPTIDNPFAVCIFLSLRETIITYTPLLIFTIPSIAGSSCPTSGQKYKQRNSRFGRLQPFRQSTKCDTCLGNFFLIYRFSIIRTSQWYLSLISKQPDKFTYTSLTTIYLYYGGRLFFLSLFQQNFYGSNHLEMI